MAAPQPEPSLPDACVMRLIQTLRDTIDGDDSPFRIQLMREDIARLEALRNMVGNVADREALRREAMAANWTASDGHTQALKDQVVALSDAVYTLESAQNGGLEVTDTMQAAVEHCWLQLHQIRMDRMVGCLSTPLPKPQD